MRVQGAILYLTGSLAAAPAKLVATSQRMSMHRNYTILTGGCSGVAIGLLTERLQV